MPEKEDSLTAQTDVTLTLAKQECAEHMEGMDEAIAEMKKLPLRIKAYALDDPHSPIGENVKTVHFVRHGQGFHNLMADLAKKRGQTWKQFSRHPSNPYFMSEILDAPLTEKGRQQALMLQPHVREMRDQIELVAFSPNCRALQTGALVFESLKGKVPFIAHEMIREENGVHLCDKRRATSRQIQEFPMIDFSLLESEEDVMFYADRRETKVEVATRVYKFLEWLESRPEKHVGVASHSAWLLTTFNANFECDDALKRWFHTGEMRSANLEFNRDDGV
jgi:broad specificity phosphatase PhoE